MQTGNVAEAERLYNKGMEMNADSYEIPMAYGFALAEHAQKARALQVLRSALANNPPADIRLKLADFVAQISK
jgi:thioredoxin-like negative regulator of GroEL